MNNLALSFVQCQTEHLKESFTQQGFMGRKHLLTFFFNVWESFYILAYFLSQKLVTWQSIFTHTVVLALPTEKCFAIN